MLKSNILFRFFGLMLPYIVLASYFAVRSPRQGPPKWFLYFGACYLLGSALLFSRNKSEVQGQTFAKSKSSFWVRGRAIGLVVLWSGLLLYGAYGTVMGDYPLERAIPAGLVLLGAIGSLSWLLLQDTRSHTEIER